MKKATFFTLLLAAMSGLFVLQACGPDDDDDPNPDPNPTANEFIADASTFADWMNWTLRDTSVGSDPALFGAHNEDDTNTVRRVYVRGDSMIGSGGGYPIGTVILKHTTDGDSIDAYVGMAKRGNSFNSSYGDWEFFVLNSDGTFAKDQDNNELRGKGLMSGACEGCHSQASQKDFVFTE